MKLFIKTNNKNEFNNEDKEWKNCSPEQRYNHIVKYLELEEDYEYGG